MPRNIDKWPTVFTINRIQIPTPIEISGIQFEKKVIDIQAEYYIVQGLVNKNQLDELYKDWTILHPDSDIQIDEDRYAIVSIIDKTVLAKVQKDWKRFKLSGQYQALKAAIIKACEDLSRE